MKLLSKWQFIGFIFTGVLGVILHFLYGWTGNSTLVAPFSAVNESVWEHMKLLYFPMLAFTFIEYENIGKSYSNYWCVKLAGSVTGVSLIAVLFYTLNGIFGSTPDWVNIAIFFIASALGLIFETKLMNSKTFICKSPETAKLIIVMIAFAFAVFTFFTPEIPLFQDPVTQTYGI